eukprot:10140243-Alexandrium_andersonii.AAC.1
MSVMKMPVMNMSATNMRMFSREHVSYADIRLCGRAHSNSISHGQSVCINCLHVTNIHECTTQLPCSHQQYAQD